MRFCAKQLHFRDKYGEQDNDKTNNVHLNSDVTMLQTILWNNKFGANSLNFKVVKISNVIDPSNKYTLFAFVQKIK